MQIAIDLPWARSKSTPVEIPNIELPRVDLAARVDDTKRAVSDSADALGAVAQDLSSQAATLGREAIKIGRDAARISRETARKVPQLAATGGETLRQLRSDAAATVDDLRSIRIVRDSQRGTDWKPGVALLAGASAGLATMFFLDPEQGRERRVLLADQVRRYSRISGAWLNGTARDLRNRSQGWAIEARKAATSAAESMNRSKMAETVGEGVMASPDVSQELSATDWTEPATAEAARSIP